MIRTDLMLRSDGEPLGLVAESVDSRPAGEALPDMEPISFTLEPGGSLVLQGRATTGKSGFLRCAAGLARPRRGRILVGDRDVATLGYSELRAHRLDVALVPRRDALLANVNIRDNVALPLRYHCDLTPDEIDRRVDGVMEELHCRAAGSAMPSECPWSSAKAAIIARALCLEPRILLLDDAAVGLDGGDLQCVGEAIERRRRERSLTVLAVSRTSLPAPLACERVILLEAGATVEPPSG